MMEIKSTYMIMLNLFLTAYAFFGIERQGKKGCLPEQQRDLFAVRACSRSRLRIIARANVSVQRCANLAIRKGAFAINVKPLFQPAYNLSDTCQIIACPEHDSLVTLEMNKNYDYYSLYADPLPPNGYRCIPGVGLFRMDVNARSWLSSRLACLRENAELVHIANQERANAIAAFLREQRGAKSFHRVWVGLHRLSSHTPFLTPAGDQLSCYRYRGWAPHEPRNEEKNCVAINSTRWYTVRCERKLPSICELKPGGPSLASGPGHWYYPSGRCPALRPNTFN